MDIEANVRHPRVAAVIVTYRRPEQVLATVDRVLGQTLPVHSVTVVDNAADDDVKHRLALHAPTVDYLASPDNLGPGGAFALGLERVIRHGDADWLWTLDDDSPPGVDSLQLAWQVAQARLNGSGAVGTRGGHIVHGRIRHDLPVGSVQSPTPADFILVDGALISADVVRAVGYPRTDYFIMMEDLEYSLRMSRAGFPLLVRAADQTVNLYQGSGAPWRGYYQSRNHLRMAIEERSLPLAWGWASREAAIIAVHASHGRWKHVGLRGRGARDAIRGRMGRRLDPTST